jgi:hypothetical protein
MALPPWQGLCFNCDRLTMYTHLMAYLRTIIVLACCTVTLHVQAKYLPHEREPARSVTAVVLQAGMSLDQAAAMVQAKYGAQVMRANTVQEDGRTVHYIRLMSADRSRVWTVRVDAATGREF